MLLSTVAVAFGSGCRTGIWAMPIIPGWNGGVCDGPAWAVGAVPVAVVVTVSAAPPVLEDVVVVVAVVDGAVVAEPVVFGGLSAILPSDSRSTSLETEQLDLRKRKR